MCISATIYSHRTPTQRLTAGDCFNYKNGLALPQGLLIRKDGPHGQPDILALGRVKQEFLTLALLRVKPIPVVTVVDPRALDVARRCELDKAALT